MGNDPLAGHAVQYRIPAGVWQAGHLVSGGRYALFGCTMAPGWTDDVFELGERARLLAAFPAAAERIAALTRSVGF